MLKIYVADLERYNAGYLVGEWFDLMDFEDVDELRESIGNMLGKNNNEEWAIHDYDTDLNCQLSEHESLDLLMEVKEAIETNGIEHVSAYCQYHDGIKWIEDIDNTIFYADTLENLAYYLANERFQADNIDDFYINNFNYKNYEQELSFSYFECDEGCLSIH